MPGSGKGVENIRVKIMEGSIYTVDEVSDLLGIPSPTLYRYLREYSIPHLRRGGRIRIPEDSFDRIREARDLHREGLGTDSVRRQLREGAGPDTGELDRRLNKLHDTLEDLRGDLREKPATAGVALSPTLRTILARQSLMLSAMFNLTGMVEEILISSGKPRKQVFDELHDEPVQAIPLPVEGRAQISGTVLAEPAPVRDAPPPARVSGADHPPRVGSLGRRRRRSTVAVFSVLLLGLLLAFLLPTLDEDGTATTDRPDPSNPAVVNDPPSQDRGEADGDGNTPREEANGEPGNVATAKQTAPPTDGNTSTEERRGESAADPAGGVPDVSGQTLEEAAKTVSEAGYTVAAVESVTGSEESGTVVGTEPTAGTRADPEAPVVLITSAGPASVSSASASPASTSSASASSTAVSSASSSASAPSTP